MLLAPLLQFQKQAAHDLILILYAKAQRTPTSNQVVIDGRDSLSVEFALAGAVNLAGGAAKLTERAMGNSAKPSPDSPPPNINMC